MATTEDFAALTAVTLVAHDHQWSVVYSPGGPHQAAETDATFAAHGLDAGGYGFSGALQGSLAAIDPTLLERIGLDPEAGMVAVYGTDLDALLVAARALQSLIVDPEALDVAIRAALAAGYEMD